MNLSTQTSDEPLGIPAGLFADTPGKPHAGIFGLSLAAMSAACLVLNAASPSIRVYRRYRGDAVRGSLPCTVALWTRHVAPITW
jgi:hypothetical protein